MKNKIVVFGSLNIDFVIRTQNFPQKGETITGLEYFTAPGGKGANQAVATSRLKSSTHMVGVVGKDIFGDSLLKNLKNNKVSTQFVYRSDKNTGSAFITLDQKAANSIVVIPGSNHLLEIKLLKQPLSKIKKNDIVITQLEIPIPTVEHVINESKKRGAIVILNPSPLAKLSRETLGKVDILVLNEIEARNIIPGLQKLSFQEIGRKLISIGVGAVVITLGEKGSILYKKDEKEAQFPAMKVKSVDTTGAGDAFVGALGASLLRKRSIEESIKFATIVAAISTTKLGAQPSLPSFDEVEIYWKKIIGE